ncbi:MFS transporter [Oceanobacillus polygoni]|uniref:PPP family 3-phenylpropionic acid transporter n=1 Tax=Oceanobacillus polygoni TaxID=1235259 RepID=A0A9X0YW51_9BACI|nr:MFS transporter [Oceanobacillus polygoni]MBP2079758.1 PPP family 3-phenylpropionic acid transporter [Oceanobacillus polygoni]
MSIQKSLLPLKTLFVSFHASNTILISFLPLYLHYRGLNGTEIGWVLAVESLASLLAQPIWGYLSDKYKTVRKILFICVIGLLIGSSIFFQMDTLSTILITGAAFYFFATPIGALSDSLAQRRADELNISFGSIRMWGSVGFAISALIVGRILDQFGVQYMMWPYLFFGLIILFVLIPMKDVKVESEPVKLIDVRKIIANKPFLLFLSVIVFITITHRMNDYYMALYITELGGSESLVGLAWFVGVISEALIFALAGLWFRKYRTLIFIIAAAILYTIRWFLYAAVDDPMHVIALQFMHGLTFGVFYTAAFEYVTRLIPKFLQSTGHLIFFSVYFGLSGIIGSLAGGPIMEVFSGSTMYLFMGTLAAIGTVSLILYHLLPFGKENAVRDTE